MSNQKRLGVAIVGLGGAVATTAVAGMELLRRDKISHNGLPLATLDTDLTKDLIAYGDLAFGGWDLYPENLYHAAATHRVLSQEQLAAVAEPLSAITPWPAVGNSRFCRNVEGQNRVMVDSHRAAVETIQNNLREFRQQHDLDRVVVVNLASTERYVDLSSSTFQTPQAFEASIEQNDPEISPAMLYAYAAISDGIPYVNFTPSVATDLPALIQLAAEHNAPVAGKDGKTGQTMMKTVIASALRSRALHVDGWFSTNILGNRDGMALADEETHRSKVATKRSVIDQILGYHVEDHIVQIHYYRPRGDNKEAWDNIDITGFIDQPMQIKVNFLCRDSVLAAPLVIELARLIDLAQRRGGRGVQEQLGMFFKLPMTAEPGASPEHALHIQEQRLLAWLANDAARTSERSQ